MISIMPHHKVRQLLACITSPHQTHSCVMPCAAITRSREDSMTAWLVAAVQHTSRKCSSPVHAPGWLGSLWTPLLRSLSGTCPHQSNCTVAYHQHNSTQDQMSTCTGNTATVTEQPSTIEMTITVTDNQHPVLCLSKLEQLRSHDRCRQMYVSVCCHATTAPCMLL